MHWAEHDSDSTDLLVAACGPLSAQVLAFDRAELNEVHFCCTGGRPPSGKCTPVVLQLDAADTVHVGHVQHFYQAEPPNFYAPNGFE